MNEAYTEFINFFKKHNLYNEEAFNYIRNNSKLIDYREEEKREYIGCYYVFDQKKSLNSIKLIVPYITDKITILINIHEYIHAIIFYQHLGKKIKIEEDIEVLPILFEQLYSNELQNPKLQKYLENLNNHIKKTSPIEYQIALAIKQELLTYYYQKNPTFQKLQNKSKKLSKKYKKKLK